jgi:hypothetical protein
MLHQLLYELLKKRLNANVTIVLARASKGARTPKMISEVRTRNLQMVTEGD